jgi:zinc-ribbon domain
LVCPNCKLLNPTGALRCDCGYEFSQGIVAVYLRRVLVRLVAVIAVRIAESVPMATTAPPSIKPPPLPCTRCGAELEPDAHFCSSCGAPALGGGAPEGPGGTLAGDSERYRGLFGKRHRDSDFRAQVEQALADDILTVVEEQRLLGWAEAQGITVDDWKRKFSDLFDRMLIASVNNGRLPDVTAKRGRSPVRLKEGEVAHYVESASLLKEVAQRELRGGGSGVSFRVAKGVTFRTGAFRARSVVIGKSWVEADKGTLTITSLQTMFSGQRKTLELPHAKLLNLNVYSDGISFNMSNRQTVPLFRVHNGQVVAAIVNAAVARQVSIKGQ